MRRLGSAKPGSLSPSYGHPDQSFPEERERVRGRRGGFALELTRQRGADKNLCCSLLSTNCVQKAPQRRARIEDLATRCPFTGVSRAQRARETPKKSEKRRPGAPAAGPPPREAGKSVEKVCSGPFRDLFQTLETYFETFSRLSGGFRLSRLISRLFQTLSGSLGPEGPKRPLQMVNGFPIEDA